MSKNGMISMYVVQIVLTVLLANISHIRARTTPPQFVPPTVGTTADPAEETEGLDIPDPPEVEETPGVGLNSNTATETPGETTEPPDVDELPQTGNAGVMTTTEEPPEMDELSQTGPSGIMTTDEPPEMEEMAQITPSGSLTTTEEPPEMEEMAQITPSGSLTTTEEPPEMDELP